MGNKTKKSAEDAKKYRRERDLANARNRKYKANMSEEKLEKKRERDRQRYHRLKQEKKIKLVGEMTEKEKKQSRKIWRKRKAVLRKKKKEEEDMLINTPPNSDIEGGLPVTKRDSRQKQVGRKLVRKERAKVYRELRKQKEDNKKLKAKLEKYKKRLQRERSKSSSKTSPSPGKHVRHLIGNEKVSPKIKKRLFAGYVLEKQLKSSVQSTTPKTKESQIMARVIGTKILRKYRMQKQFTSIISYNRNRKVLDNNINFNRKSYFTIKAKEALAIKKFFLSDQVSKMLPGKKDYVKKGQVKIQRRLLNDTLANLYTMFKEQTNINVSYTTFTRSRPFWVQKPTKCDRETCACSKHENIELLVKALGSEKLIVFSSAHELLKSLVCSTSDENCMFGRCKKCVSNEVYIDKDAQEVIKLSQWESIMEKKIIKGKEKTIKKVMKVTKEHPMDEVISMFHKQIVEFKKHVYAMKHQWDSLTTLTKTLKEGELVFQVDFAQNYVAKCSSEIQSMHFGASKPQISLHTGVMHFRQDEEINCRSFCTLSDNIDHMTYAVWAHLEPILKKAANDFPQTHSVYFYSDSPSSQYRNKTNVYFMRELLPKMFKNLNHFSWNFMESGHGKGAMDGVGGSIKRNADQHVLHGKDMTCAWDLSTAFKNSSTFVVEVPKEKIENYKMLVPPKLDVIKGIMQVRQIFWNGTSLYGRKMTCFQCKEKCSHFHYRTIENLTKRPVLETQPKKRKLAVSDVYSSSEDENITQSSSEITYDPNYDFNDLRPEAFVVVSFNLGKTKKRFVAVIQSEVSSDREVEVLFMKRSNDSKIFKPDENDVSWIGCDQILGTLPTPSMFFQGDRLFYKFDKPVSF